MKTRVVRNWEHDFRTGTARIYVDVKDDEEGTTVTVCKEMPDSLLPAALRTWEQARATALGAVLAEPPASQ